MSSPGLELAQDLARTSGGVLTRSQLLRAGCSPRMADRQVRAGRWQRPARGVYVPHNRELTGLDLGHVAAARAGSRVVVSGLVVLRELGLRWLPPSDHVLALVDPAIRTPSSGRVTLRRTKELDALSTWRRDDLDLAPVTRAVVDAAREITTCGTSVGWCWER
jgi:hypothetical protein